VQRSGERLRANVQLMEAGGARTLWAERYEGALQDVFDMQDRLVSELIAALSVELAPLERESLARRSTTSVVAYDHYLRGVEAHGRRSREQNLLAREQFRTAIAIDPRFARAYAGLALTHSRDAIDGWVSTPWQSLEQAAELAAAAAALDSALPQVHFVSGQVDLFRRRHSEAIAATERAIAVNPSYADAYALRAWILNYAGRSDDALLAMEQALRLNPRPTASYLEVLGEIRFAQGRFADSVAVFERVLDINPNYARARMWLAAALAQAGALDEARWEATELAVLSPDFALEHLDFAFPFKDEHMLEVVLDGLRTAGLPDRLR
jgi:Flp pilus assembly protein TadD